MFITNHVLAGTIAGTALRRRPLLAFGVGFATHVAMDLTPHWGNPTIGRDGFFVVAKRDGVLGLGALALIAVAGVPPRTALLAGIAGAAILDSDKPCEFLLGFNPWPRPVDRFHKAGVKAGGKDNGAPGPRADYSPTYYAAFLIDPDGNNVEAVCMT